MFSWRLKRVVISVAGRGSAVLRFMSFQLPLLPPGAIHMIYFDNQWFIHWFLWYRWFIHWLSLILTFRIQSVTFHIIQRRFYTDTQAELIQAAAIVRPRWSLEHHKTNTGPICPDESKRGLQSEVWYHEEKIPMTPELNGCCWPRLGGLWWISNWWGLDGLFTSCIMNRTEM